MTDPVIENSQQWTAEWAAIARERDELRAQFNQYVRGAEREASELRVEIERLRADHDHRKQLLADALEERKLLFAEIERLRAASPDDIRAEGWTVAVHNDYRYVGVQHTFWLFTKDGRAIKGEGRTDADALAEVRRQIG